jgi:hypothetical protein
MIEVVGVLVASACHGGRGVRGWKCYAASALYTTLANLSGALWRMCRFTYLVGAWFQLDSRWSSVVSCATAQVVSRI